MIRYTLFIAAVLGTAATALAAVHAAPDAQQISAARMTVIEKNDLFPVLGPIIVEECAVEDCSDVQI